MHAKENRPIKLREDFFERRMASFDKPNHTANKVKRGTEIRLDNSPVRTPEEVKQLRKEAKARHKQAPLTINPVKAQQRAAKEALDKGETPPTRKTRKADPLEFEDKKRRFGASPMRQFLDKIISITR